MDPHGPHAATEAGDGRAAKMAATDPAAVSPTGPGHLGKRGEVRGEAAGGALSVTDGVSCPSPDCTQRHARPEPAGVDPRISHTARDQSTRVQSRAGGAACLLGPARVAPSSGQSGGRSQQDTGRGRGREEGGRGLPRTSLKQSSAITQCLLCVGVRGGWVAHPAQRRVTRPGLYL